MAVLRGGIGAVGVRHEHVGDQGRGQMSIDGTGEYIGRFAHRLPPLKLLPAAQEFVIDGTDLVHDAPGALMIGQELFDLLLIGLGYVIHLGSFASPTDGEIVFWTVATAFGAFAAGFSAAFVAFD